jgi:F-type H+-transporting ATPase subunit gamma
MATLRDIRDRISSVKSTQQITKAMKMIAAAKLRRAQENILALRPYADSLAGLINDLTGLNENQEKLELLAGRPVEKVLIASIAADRGMCGGFNSNVIRATLARIENYKNTQCELFTIGNKSSEFFRKRNYPVYDKRLHFFHHLTFENATDVTRSLISAFTSKKFDRIEIVYNEFKSAMQQEVVTDQFLPFKVDDVESKETTTVDYIHEPDINTLLETLIPKHLNIQIWRSLLESNASEQGARMTAMENATSNAEEIKSKLTLTYNRARQAAITKELAEIIGGADALKES